MSICSLSKVTPFRVFHSLQTLYFINKSQQYLHYSSEIDAIVPDYKFPQNRCYSTQLQIFNNTSFPSSTLWASVYSNTSFFSKSFPDRLIQFSKADSTDIEDWQCWISLILMKPVLELLILDTMICNQHQ